MQVGYKTDRGLVRTNNEDALFVDEEVGLFIVVDGLGGHNAGEIAGAMAVETIASYVLERLPKDKDPESVLTESVHEANAAIFRSAEENPAWADMGATVVIALLNGDHFLICHVGDSRAYIVGGDGMRLLTRDHTFVADCVEQGLMTPEEARTHEARHGLTRALGVEDETEPAISCAAWKSNERLLLCSDGLTDFLNEDEILSVVRSFTEPHDACRELVERAKQAGGGDNITVILARPE